MRNQLLIHMRELEHPPARKTPGLSFTGAQEMSKLLKNSTKKPKKLHKKTKKKYSGNIEVRLSARLMPVCVDVSFKGDLVALALSYYSGAQS